MRLRRQGARSDASPQAIRLVPNEVILQLENGREGQLFSFVGQAFQPAICQIEEQAGWKACPTSAMIFALW